MRADVGITSAGGGNPVSAVADQSGLSNNATCTSPHRPVYEVNIFKSSTLPAIYFERVSVSEDQIDMTTRLTFPSGFSAFVYFKVDPTDAPRTTTTTTGNVPMTIIGDNSASFVSSFGLNGGNVSYNYKSAGSFVATTSSSLSLGGGNVHSIAVTHTVGGTVTIYADGSSVGTGTRSYDTVNTGFNIIGCGKSQTDQFWGDIAEVRIYSGALTASQVTALHSAATTKWA